MFLQFSVSQGRVKKDFIIFAKFSAENNPFFSSTCSEMEIPLCVFDTFIKMRRWGHHPCWILRVWGWVILLYFFYMFQSVLNVCATLLGARAPLQLVCVKKTCKELRKPQRPTALHVTKREFKRYNDLRSTSQSTK